jgi:hypothetical protein
MKTNYISSLLIVVTALTFQSCVIPWNWNYSYEPAPSYSVNTTKFIEEKKYEADQPFTARDQSVSVPMLSQKGQVNWSANIIHGLNSNIAIAVSKKMFITAGGTYMHSTENTKETGGMEVTSEIWDSDHYNYATAMNTFDYNLDKTISNLSINVGAGFYKTFSKNGRWDYFASFNHGNASTQYNYSFDNSGYLKFNQSAYTFIESRNFNQVFLQSDFGYVSNHSEGAIVARAAWTHFTTQKFESEYPIPTYAMRKDEFVFQPTLHFAYGGTLRIFSNVGWNVPLGDNQMKWFSTNVQLGFILKFKDKSIL